MKLVALRICAVTQAVLLLSQAISAGLMLSGRAEFVSAHGWGGRLAQAASLCELVFAGLVAVRIRAARRLIPISAALFLIQLAEIYTGYRRNLAIHVPLGVGIMIGVTTLIRLTWSRDLERSRA